jgi:hypothetical protein
VGSTIVLGFSDGGTGARAPFSTTPCHFNYNKIEIINEVTQSTQQPVFYINCCEDIAAVLQKTPVRMWYEIYLLQGFQPVAVEGKLVQK